MEDSVQVVLVTFPDEASAERIAATLVAEKLAACVNLIPGVKSIYRWEGAVESSQEVQGVIKTTVTRYPELEAHILASHPYEVPEIIALPVANGSPRYLAWVRQVTSSAAS